LILTDLDGIGISRANKIIALFNQNEYGIYDSRASDGLSDLLCKGKRVLKDKYIEYVLNILKDKGMCENDLSTVKEALKSDIPTKSAGLTKPKCSIYHVFLRHRDINKRTLEQKSINVKTSSKKDAILRAELLCPGYRATSA
jgi:hypothetical protein